jgi:HEPN domain-containing protein
MTPLEKARLLLDKAIEDEAAMLVLAAAPTVGDAIVAFHAQQSVEKFLKAVLASRGVAYPFTHDLLALIDLAEAIEPFPIDATDAMRLTPYGARFRYEIPSSGAVPLDRAWATHLVSQSRRWAEHVIARG